MNKLSYLDRPALLLFGPCSLPGSHDGGQQAMQATTTCQVNEMAIGNAR